MVMSNHTKEEIHEAQARIWEGQHWTRTTEKGGDVWPKSLVITEGDGFIRCLVTTMAIKPQRKLGRTFPIRADILTDNYELTYDPVNKVGRLQEKIDDYEITLNAIAEAPHDDVEKLKRMAKAVLKGTQWDRADEEAHTVSIIDEILEADNPDMYKGP